MEIPIYQVDAFTSQTFGGNPAAVCPLDSWLPDEIMQSVAAENNLSETAFFVPADDGFDLRWFTPTSEVDLCGHATLATGFVIATYLQHEESRMRFSTRSGPVEVQREGDLFTLDFPSNPPHEIDDPNVDEALGVETQGVWLSTKTLALLADESTVRSVAPDMGLVSRIRGVGLIITAPGDDCDFVSRFFAPNVGVPEDPVTGSAHTVLTPFWSQRLGKTRLEARQVSKRGGELVCEDCGERVRISGRVAPYLIGTISI